MRFVPCSTFVVSLLRLASSLESPPSCTNSPSTPSGISGSETCNVDTNSFLQIESHQVALPLANRKVQSQHPDADTSGVWGFLQRISNPTHAAWQHMVAKGKHHWEQLKPVKEKGLDSWDTFDTALIFSMIFVLVFFDLYFAPQSIDKVRSHFLALGFMVFASGIFCGFVWVQRGRTDGVAWATGYALEWALSLDNLFLFHLLFKGFSVPQDQCIKALSIGIYGAVLFRVVFIVCLSKAFEMSYIVDIAMGVLLIVSGLMSLSDSDDEEDVQNSRTVQFFKWLLGNRLQDTYSDTGQLFTRNEAGEIQMTLLLLVVCVVSVVDCVFAVDSVGSKTGQIKSVFINLTSSLMAMFSLRSLFFIIKDFADYFEHVKYGICLILCGVGAEMIFGLWFPVPLDIMCIIICFIFVSSVVASVVLVTKSPGDDNINTKTKDVGNDCIKVGGGMTSTKGQTSGSDPETTASESEVAAG